MNEMHTIFGPISLGALIAALKKLNPEAIVTYDFCGIAPGVLASYRGFYDHLALGRFESGWQGPELPTVASVLADCEAAVGKAFEGYKGGSFIMGNDTPVWVANKGECHSTGVVGVTEEYESSVILQTAWCET